MHPAEGHDLVTLRSQIREVDAAIAGLVGRRQELARKIGEEKERLGLPVRDFETEKQVLQAAAREAERQGLERDLLEGIALHLIRGAVRLQSRERSRRPSWPQGEGRPACVIGGGGHMGRWFLSFLASRGYRTGVVEAGDPIDDALAADLVVVAVDLASTAGVVDQLAVRRPRGTVLEISSLKSPLLDRASGWVDGGMRFASIHPMFGADADLLAGQNLIVCQAGCPEAEDEAALLFADSAVHVLRLPIAEHDRFMTWVLNLPHLVNLLAADLLASSELPYARLRELGGTTFNRQREVTAEVAAENPELYYSIQRLNRHRRELFDAVRASLERIAGDIEAGRREAFVARMLGWENWFRGGESADQRHSPPGPSGR